MCVWIVFQFNTKLSPQWKISNTKKANWRLIMWIVVAQSWPIYDEIFFKWIKHVRACWSEAHFWYSFRFLKEKIFTFISLFRHSSSSSLTSWFSFLPDLYSSFGCKNCVLYSARVYISLLISSLLSVYFFEMHFHIVNLMDLKIQFGEIMAVCCWMLNMIR